jgi:hypothetical protein
LPDLPKSVAYGRVPYERPSLELKLNGSGDICSGFEFMNPVIACLVCIVVGVMQLAFRYADGLGFDFQSAEQILVWLSVLVYPFCCIQAFVSCKSTVHFKRFSATYMSLFILALKSILGGPIFDAGLSRRLFDANHGRLKKMLAELAENADAGSYAGAALEKLQGVNAFKNVDKRVNYASVWSCANSVNSRKSALIFFGGGFRQWMLIYSTEECMGVRYKMLIARPLGEGVWVANVRK